MTPARQTALVRRPRSRPVRQVTLSGATAAELAAKVAAVRRSGRAVAMTLPAARADGTVFVDVTLTVRPRGRRRAALAAAVATPVLVAGVYALWALAQLLDFLAEHALMIVGALALAWALLFLRPGHRALCPGLHCSGCRG